MPKQIGAPSVTGLTIMPISMSLLRAPSATRPPRYQSWVGWVSVSAARNSKPEVCFIELGGTIGDIKGMAFWQFQFRVRCCNFCASDTAKLGAGC